MISEWSKLVHNQHKTRHKWVENVIHRELCKKFKFDHANKWYMHNSEFVRENETHKILLDFEIQTDHLISSRQPDLEINQGTCCVMDFAVPANHRVKMKESEKRYKYLNFARELKKTMECEDDGDTMCK